MALILAPPTWATRNERGGASADGRAGWASPLDSFPSVYFHSDNLKEIAHIPRPPISFHPCAHSGIARFAVCADFSTGAPSAPWMIGMRWNHASVAR